MISDLVFLNGSAPEDILDAEEGEEVGVWFRAKNIEMIALSKLGEKLGVEGYKELMSGFRPAVDPEGESVILTFPKSLQSKLACLTDSEIESVSKVWAGIDEFDGHASVDSLVNYLKAVREYLSGVDEPVYLLMAI